jgi:hypothetical protein
MKEIYRHEEIGLVGENEKINRREKNFFSK